MVNKIRSQMATYVNRFQVNAAYFLESPACDLDLIIVIPCYKEPDLISTLNSLIQCDRTVGTVEILLVINAPEGSSKVLLEDHEESFQNLQLWIKKQKPENLKVFIIREESLQMKHAGAGWARKIGMDEALRRWALLGKDGPIICLDADCTVSADYLTAAKRAFDQASIQLAHFQFEHQLPPDPALRNGIIQYELHLRCYIQGLRWAAYPFAVHTVGSCMAVRASAYAKAGGMNRKKAGEDFYFMHKLLPLAGFTYLEGTVFPSARSSDRVPFGTGRAQLEFASLNGIRETYQLKVYEALKAFFEQVPLLYNDISNFLPGHPELWVILKQQQFEEQVLEMKAQSNSQSVFYRRFWQWMDGFRVLKLTHFLRDQYFPNQPVDEVATAMLARFGMSVPKQNELLLQKFRQLDRNQ